MPLRRDLMSGVAGNATFRHAALVFRFRSQWLHASQDCDDHPKRREQRERGALTLLAGKTDPPSKAQPEGAGNFSSLAARLSARPVKNESGMMMLQGTL